jgi:hypothetical protein
MQLNGLDYLFYSRATGLNDERIYYIVSAGIGQPWSTEGTLVGTKTDEGALMGGVQASAGFGENFGIMMLWETF